MALSFDNRWTSLFLPGLEDLIAADSKPVWDGEAYARSVDPTGMGSASVFNQGTGGQVIDMERLPNGEYAPAAMGSAASTSDVVHVSEVGSWESALR